MKETYVYHGHSIDLDLGDIPRARIRWTYFIDGLYCVQGASDSSQIDAVRVDALARAHRSIDVLDSMRSGQGNPLASRATDPGVAPLVMEHGAQRIAARQSRGAVT